MSYKLQLEMFEGPLDLLLYLIKKNDLDIRDIPITTITEQYMQYIEMMKMLDLDVVGDFLVMAATLMQIKSRMLLPPDPNQEEETEEDPRDDLVRRLQEYKLFKEVAGHLKDKELERQTLYPRRVDDDLHRELRDDAREVYVEASLFDLISAFTKAIARFRDQPVYRVSREEFTVEQKIHDILHLLVDSPRILLFAYFGRAQSKEEVIVSFMAILELIRLKEIKVMQKRLFAEIEIVRNRDNVVPPPGGEDGGPADDAAMEEIRDDGRDADEAQGHPERGDG